MKKIFLLQLVCITSSMICSANDITTRIKHCSPSMYIRWNKGNINPTTFTSALQHNRHNFVTAALQHAKKKPGSLDLNAVIPHPLLIALSRKDISTASTIIDISNDKISSTGLVPTLFAKSSVSSDRLFHAVLQSGKVDRHYSNEDLKTLINAGSALALPLAHKALLRQLSLPHDKNLMSTIGSILALDNTKSTNFTIEELLSAIYNENSQAVKVIVEANPALLDQRDKNSDTCPFAIAMEIKNKEIIEIITTKRSVIAKQRTEYIDGILTFDKHLAKTNHGLTGRFLLLVRPYALSPIQREGFYEYHFVTQKKLDGDNIDKLIEIHKTYASADKEYTDYLERNKQCQICLEDYTNTTTIVPTCQHHTLCHRCFNNPAVSSCPSCRSELPFEKIETCQCCYNKRPDRMTFHHCVECQVTAVICSDCLAICPSCEKESPNNSEAVLKHALAIGSNAREQFVAYMQKREQETAQEIEKIAAPINEKAQSVLQAVQKTQRHILLLQAALEKSKKNIEAERARWFKNVEHINSLILMHNCDVEKINRLKTNQLLYHNIAQELQTEFDKAVRDEQAKLTAIRLEKVKELQAFGGKLSAMFSLYITKSL